MILVDTSVWIDHFHRGVPRLAAALNDGAVFTHSFVIGELACGHLRDRKTVLSLLAELPGAEEASHDEVLGFIDRHRLWGRGVGYADMHLLASAALTPPVRLLTHDRRLRAIAESLDLA